MSEKLERFVKLLKEIFELDKSDLDFGIYRVLNLRKIQIEQFLTHRLPQMVRETLAPFAQYSKEEIRKQIAQIEKDVNEMGMTLETLSNSAPKKQQYYQLQKQLSEGADLSSLETDVYSSLYSFFNRYYEDGDFISKRRYKENVYAIPYEGEEVKLYWANQDQYYIKTSENFKDYTFVFDDISVHFRLVDATTERDNNKETSDGKRVFMLFTEDEEKYPDIKTFEYNPDASELMIRFVYDIPEDKKKKYAEENYNAINAWLISLRRAELNRLIMPIPTGKGKETTTLLEKHLKRYVAKNTFDYFIHRDLDKFLTRELDFFIKSEVMHLEDLDTENESRVETYLVKIKAVKRVGKIIIEFLAQIEDFQKKLWLKKKFVVGTDWCITIDKIDESFWAEIIANKAQLAEWISLYAIDEAEDWMNPPTIDFLRKNQNLIIDTKNFSDTFKYALLASIPNLDEQTSGLIINGDNFHALNLLQANFRNNIDCIYIDPPYNTNSAPILYKDGYKNSSWLCLMNNRLRLSNVLLSDVGANFISIDDNEQANLKLLCDEIFGANNFVAQFSWKKTETPANMSLKIKKAVDYILSYTKTNAPKKFRGLKKTSVSNNGLMNQSNAPKELIFPVNIVDTNLADGIYVHGEYGTESYKISLLEDTEVAGGIFVKPVKLRGKFKWSQKKLDTEISQGTKVSIKTKAFSPSYEKNDYEPEVPWNIIDKSFGVQTNEHATNELKNIFGDEKVFEFPKPPSLIEYLINFLSDKNSIVLDYFAGSGTTGHAVINLNRADGGNRKYILVEMGEYFDTVTKPRMQKVIYCADWKNGKPQNRNSGMSQIIKYMRLESYEDALSNIELSDKGDKYSSLFGEEYIIRYMLTTESRDSLLNMENFSNPFSYSIKITEKNECKNHPVDLVETFNYLIGLKISRQSSISYYLSKPAENPMYEGALELVEDINGQYAFRKVEGILPDNRRTLVIWRIVTEDIIASNAALDAYFIAHCKGKYDVIYVNGDNNLDNLRGNSENWSVRITEFEFKRLMFEE